MATWQQGNSGSFLAGIGSNNTNAPQASDINATLGMIRDNNDRARAGENNLGMQLANATGSIFNSWKQGQQQQRQGEFQKAYAGAYSSGDRGAMRQLAAQYPEQFEAVQKGMGFIDDDQRNTVGSLAASARLAAQSPETMGKWLQSNAGELARAGVNPADVATMYQQNPQGFGEFADHLGMAAIGPEKYFEFQDKAVGRDIDRGKLAEQVRSNKAGEGLQARGQDIQIRGQNISASNSAADRDLKRLMLQEQLISNRLGQAKTELETQNLAAKLDSNKREQQELQQQKQTSLSYAAEASALAKSLSSDPNLGSVTGTINTWTPVVKDSSQDVLNTANRLHSLLTSDNLKLMSGVLTDKDITFLGNIASGLNITDKGIKGSEESIKKRLGAIAERIDSKLKAQSYSSIPNSTPQTATTDAQQPAGFSSLWGE